MAERRIEYVPVDDLVPAERNPKRHRLDVLGESITRFGYTDPIEVDERTGRLVSGHGRAEEVAALRDAGVDPPDGVKVEDGRWLVPVVRGWSSANDDEAEAYVIAANRTTELGGWDDETLASMLEHLAQSDAGLDGVGWNDQQVEELLVSVRGYERHLPGDVDPDEIPEPPPEPITKPGDLWLLGPHRVLCGDATDPAAYDRVLAGEHLAGAVVTDPPYGVGIGAKNRALDAIDRAGQVLTDLEGDQGIEQVEELWKASFACIEQWMLPGTPYYMTGPQGGDLGLLLLLLRDAKLAPRHILIWVKNRPSFSIGRLDYDYQHEPVIYGWKPGGPHPWYAEEGQASVFHIDRPQASPDHPTTKPVELFRRFIANSVPPGGWVLDPFLGSGTTVAAAELVGRRCAGIEIAPRYVDVAVARWQRLTGEKPVLEATGEPHDFLVSA